MNDVCTKTLLVVGLARNCGKTIQADIKRLLAALGSFQNLHWLVIESDSQDDTVTALQVLEKEVRNFRYISLGNLRGTLPLRTQRIAHCRNRYLEELRNAAGYRDVDYIVAADLDGINTLLTADAFLSCWARDDWDVCAANPRGPYYDIWALRHERWSPNDCWAHYKFLSDHGLGAEKAMWAAVFSRMITLDERSEWVRVDSAFGGLAVYRRQALEGASYIGLSVDGGEICEHVTLHTQLAAKGCRMFINPRLINTAFTQHSNQLRLLPGMKRKLRNFLRDVYKRCLRRATGPAPAGLKR